MAPSTRNSTSKLYIRIPTLNKKTYKTPTLVKEEPIAAEEGSSHNALKPPSTEAEASTNKGENNRRLILKLNRKLFLFLKFKPRLVLKLRGWNQFTPKPNPRKRKFTAAPSSQRTRRSRRINPHLALRLWEYRDNPEAKDVVSASLALQKLTLLSPQMVFNPDPTGLSRRPLLPSQIADHTPTRGLDSQGSHDYTSTYRWAGGTTSGGLDTWVTPVSQE
ncbi:hypothetical protein GQ44DRAFT_733611 [Phaeosphaeriaceae sp. PMI808]|nr:hypothetical protein GQ44DRAFT_733611 [Phaeosphaeriaceae sp. PMI808]